jgi:hypothetical protein
MSNFAVPASALSASKQLGRRNGALDIFQIGLPSFLFFAIGHFGPENGNAEQIAIRGNFRSCRNV